MKIAIVGAGAMGCLFGAKLSKTKSNQVFLLDVWKDHIDAINTSGLIVEENERIENLSSTITGGDTLFDTKVTNICYYNNVTNVKESKVILNTDFWVYKLRGATIGACEDDIIDIVSETAAIATEFALDPNNDNNIPVPTPFTLEKKDILYPSCVPTIGDCINDFDCF